MNSNTFILFACSLFITFNLQAEEVINSFHSEINIQHNGQLHIIENIQVTAENNQIQRGIYRDFPTHYKDSSGNISSVGFNVISIKRDKVEEDYRIQNLGNGIRIYIGNKDINLPPANYLYQIEFTTTHQLGFFKNYDELYFNVTGNGWSFPILQASATVNLPPAVNSNKIELSGYTGTKGSKDQFLTHHIVQSGQFNFETTQVLNPYEGLTIVANWPKGIIQPPDPNQVKQQLMTDNKHSLIALTGLFLVFLYYSIVWLMVGKDPEKGNIRPLHRVPDGLSPASARFISQMKYDKSCFTVALINLAIKGFISIDQNNNENYVLNRLETTYSDLASGESIILKQLFEQTDQITLTQSEHKRVGDAIKNHETSIRNDYEKLHFKTNRKFFLPGILISLACIIFAVINIPYEQMRSTTLMFSIFSMLPFIIIAGLFKRHLKSGKTPSLGKIATNIIILGVVVFILSEVVAKSIPQFDDISWPVVISIYLLIATNLMFEQWLKAPTLAGRQLLDKIEGLKLYLNGTEKRKPNLPDQPDLSGDRYQQLLPYAVALGVDHAWSSRLNKAIQSGLVQQDYRPEGFLYRNENHDFNYFSESISSGLDSAISSASTAPGTSSGSTGGGSAGGGGGGGGGGGW